MLRLLDFCLKINWKNIIPNWGQSCLEVYFRALASVIAAFLHVRANWHIPFLPVHKSIVGIPEMRSSGDYVDFEFPAELLAKEVGVLSRQNLVARAHFPARFLACQDGRPHYLCRHKRRALETTKWISSDSTPSHLQAPVELRCMLRLFLGLGYGQQFPLEGRIRAVSKANNTCRLKSFNTYLNLVVLGIYQPP